MVNLLGDWEEIERYTRQLSSIAKIGSYQLKKSEEGIEIKARVGKFGYIKKFKESEDPELSLQMDDIFNRYYGFNGS